MSSLAESVKRRFPLNKIEDVVIIFKEQLENVNGPNLAMLSILVGYIENQLTCNRNLTQTDEEDTNSNSDDGGENEPFPEVELAPVEALYCKFQSQIKGSVDMSKYRGSRFSSRELVKKVSDVVWSSLTRSYYKDRAHLQSLYSYLTGNKLDCFGVAFSVVAACQVLNLADVHLALSEDHAWVTFGKDAVETAEVTWHGKGNEDKRGQPVTESCVEKSWLYLNGYPIKCTRFTEVAALVSGINPSINATTDSVELACLQQKLLWLLYDKGHLGNYPMALGNLGDLEEISPTPGRPPPHNLFLESVLSAKNFYNDHHVYPYTYLGGFFYRNGRYKEALEAWSNAASVIRKFNYNREDEEIYKEFLEIANELIPHIIKVVNSGGCEPSGLCATPLLQDAHCFASLLKFYDGLCAWEEESPTPVLHIGWARPLVSTISKFLYSVRASVDILIPKSENERQISNVEVMDKSVSLKNSGDQETVQVESKTLELNGSSNPKEVTKDASLLLSLKTKFDSNDEPHPNIAKLAAACGDNIFNPDYLLGSSEGPFSRGPPQIQVAEKSFALNGNGKTVPTCPEVLKVPKTAVSIPLNNIPEVLKVSNEKVCVILSSQKMAGLKDLLLAEKLNTSAIQLQLTAQSQVHVAKRGRSNTMTSNPITDFELHTLSSRSSKRTRRE